MLRHLVADDDPLVVRNALLTALRLRQVHPDLALDIALAANVGTDVGVAEDLCMAISEGAADLVEAQATELLSKLEQVERLEYWSQQRPCQSRRATRWRSGGLLA